MKKIMIALALVAATAVSNGAEIRWGARNIFIPVAADVSVSQDGIVASSGTKFAADALTVSLFWVDSKGENQFIGDFKTTGEGVIGATSHGSGVESDLYLKMVADQGASWKPEYAFTATYTTSDGVYTYEGSATAGSPIGNLAQGNIAVTANFAQTGSWSYTAASVPEPTSGLLLLLGMAGLALRRKQK